MCVHVRMFTNELEDWGSIQCRVILKSQKMVLDATLTLSILSYGSRVKWSNPVKGVAPSLTPRYSSYCKGSVWVAIDYGFQHYLL